MNEIQLQKRSNAPVEDLTIMQNSFLLHEITEVT